MSDSTQTKDLSAEEMPADDKQSQEELSDQELKGATGGVGRPPSGDANPSDLTNSTVDTSDIINPHPSK